MYVGQWCLSRLQSRHLGSSHSSPNCHQLPHCIFLNLIDYLKSLPFPRWFYFWEKPEVSGHHIWVTVGAEFFDVLLKHSAADVMHERAHEMVIKLPITSCPELWPSELSGWVCGGMFKFNTKFDGGSLLYSISHIECDSHTVHVLTRQQLPPPLTSTVKSSLLTHAHSSPLSLAARLHWCHTNHSCYVNIGWSFTGQTSYIQDLVEVMLTWLWLVGQ